MTEPGVQVLDRGEDEVVIRLSDTTLRSGLSDLRWHLTDRVLGDARSLTVDLSAVDRLSSAVVAVLLRAQRCCRVRGGSVVLRAPAPGAVRMLNRTGLWEVFEVEGAPAARGRLR